MFSAHGALHVNDLLVHVLQVFNLFMPRVNARRTSAWYKESEMPDFSHTDSQVWKMQSFSSFDISTHCPVFMFGFDVHKKVIFVCKNDSLTSQICEKRHGSKLWAIRRCSFRMVSC
jgi:hypothetical protein